MATKKEQIAQEAGKAVNAGKAVSMETVDFNDPNRPKTCLEVDFPIIKYTLLIFRVSCLGNCPKRMWLKINNRYVSLNFIWMSKRIGTNVFAVYFCLGI